jgi:hypothetical protein
MRHRRLCELLAGVFGDFSSPEELVALEGHPSVDEWLAIVVDGEFTDQELDRAEKELERNFAYYKRHYESPEEDVPSWNAMVDVCPGAAVIDRLVTHYEA